MCVAVVLDPRYKFILLEYYFLVNHGDEQYVTEIANVRELCCELLEEYGSKFPHLREREVQEKNVSTSTSTRRLDVLSNFDRFVRASYRVENMKSELDLYLDPQVLSLHSGKSLEPAFDAATMTRTGSFLGLASTGSYGHSPVYGYNGLATGPTMSFSNPMYGPGGAIPCMLDSRGTLMPQNLVSTAPPFPQHPFIMGMANAHPSLNGAGPSRPNFDLNSGFVVEGGGNRDSVLRPFFISGQGRPLEEQLRTNSQPPSSSAIGGKRKEPDGGWEAYQFSYKQHQPPSWKQ